MLRGLLMILWVCTAFTARAAEGVPLPDEATLAVERELPGRADGATRAMDSSSRVTTWAVTAVGDRAVAPGADVAVAVVFDHQPNWHVHTHAPDVPPELGDASFYIATAVAADVPAGAAITAHVDRMQWPDPVAIEVAFAGTPVMYEVFAGRAVAYLPVTVAADAQPGTYTLPLTLTFQACDDKNCLRPVMAQPIELSIEVAPLEAVQQQPRLPDAQRAALDDLFTGFDGSVWRAIRAGEPVAVVPDNDAPAVAQTLAIPFVGTYDLSATPAAVYAVLMVGIAMLGGLVLNFTPCVLPVIPLKVMALSRSASSTPRRLLLAGVMFIGLVAFWVTIGLLIASAQGFEQVNQLFQNGWFGIGVGVFIAVMAVGMIGLFTIPLPQSVYAVSPTSETIPGAFGYGIMTAILATPCAGPFMGSAIGWATQTGTATVLLVFACIGVGMALPYLLLAAFPKLVDKLPRTGPGSELLKQVMGLLLLAAAAFFIGTGLNATLGDGTASGGSWHWVGVWAFIAVAGLWLAYRAVRIGGRRPAALTFAALGTLTLVVAASRAVSVTRAELSGAPHGVIAWVYYTPDRFQQALDAGDVVVMDFTADWCINCKVLERTVLEQPRIADLLNGEGVTPVKVDLTSEANVAGSAKLASLNRHTIPLLAVYRPDGELVFLDDFYTAEQVATAIATAREQ